MAPNAYACVCTVDGRNMLLSSLDPDNFWSEFTPAPVLRLIPGQLAHLSKLHQYDAPLFPDARRVAATYVIPNVGVLRKRSVVVAPYPVEDKELLPAVVRVAGKRLFGSNLTTVVARATFSVPCRSIIFLETPPAWDVGTQSSSLVLTS